MIYTVTFNPAIDYVVCTNSMTLGEVNRTTQEEIYFGGKGINVSAVLRELGIESVALGFTAGFTGRAIEEGVSEMGITADFIRLEKGFSRINLKIRSEKETELNGQGPSIPAEALEQLMQKLDQLQDNDILVLAGSIPGSLPSDIYEQIMQRYHQKLGRCGRFYACGFIAGSLNGGCEYALRLGTACGGATAFSEGLAKKAMIDDLLTTLA